MTLLEIFKNSGDIRELLHSIETNKHTQNEIDEVLNIYGEDLPEIEHITTLLPLFPQSTITPETIQGLSKRWPSTLELIFKYKPILLKDEYQFLNFKLEKRHNMDNWSECVSIFHHIMNYHGKLSNSTRGEFNWEYPDLDFSTFSKNFMTRKIRVLLKETINCVWDIFVFACFFSNVKVVSSLLKTGFYDINYLYIYGPHNYTTPLHLAIHQDPSILELFISTGKADLNLENTEGFTPFSEACYSGAHYAAKIMYETGQCKLDERNCGNYLFASL